MLAARGRHYGRVFAYAARSCADCGSDLTGAPSARQRCQPCQATHRLARRRRDETATAVARNRTRCEDARQAAAPRLCRDCGQPVVLGRGRPPVRCLACRATNKAVSPEARRAPAAPAQLCPFEPSRTSSPDSAYPFLW